MSGRGGGIPDIHSARGCEGSTFSWSVKRISRLAFSPEGRLWVMVRLMRRAPGAASSFPTGPAGS